MTASRRLPAPVVSVGNLVVGGTGKTPAVLWIAEHLASRGKRPAILSRGYGGRAGRGPLVVSDGRTAAADSLYVGDEPAMLARRADKVCIVAGSDRYGCGLHASQALGADCFVLDDGYQHTRLHRDLNLLLLDSSRPFGNGRLLPAGPLREPKATVARADMVIFTRWDKREGGQADRALVTEIAGEENIVTASHRYAGLYAAADGKRVGAGHQRKRALLVSGIASPRSFEDTVRGGGHTVLGHLIFPDHHRYSKGEVEAIKREAMETGAELILTTEKDAVRLPASAARLELPLYCVRIEFVIEKGLGVLREALERLLL